MPKTASAMQKIVSGVMRSRKPRAMMSATRIG